MTAPLASFAVARAFGDETAVDGVDLEVHAGEIHAIVGLNGAGKTTLMRLLLGMLRPDRGRATVLGFDALDAPSTLWRGVGHLIEQPFAYPELTVRENLRASAVLHAVSRSMIEPGVEDVIEGFGLGHWADRR